MKIYNKIICNILSHKGIKKYFQKHGFELIKRHYYSPLPDLNEIRNNKEYLNNQSLMEGVSIDLENQITLLRSIIPLYWQECWKNSKNYNNNELAFDFENDSFGYQPAFILYSLIRHLRPNYVIEVGAGNSTLLSATACNKNLQENIDSKLISIEPFPKDFIKQAIPGLHTLIQEKLQDIELSYFKKLKKNDILFIDSSHIVQANSDVTYIFLEILPILETGVYVHFHDIFLPFNYPREWYINYEAYWTEQYLLQAFLCFNPEFEVVISNYSLDKKHNTKLNEIIPKPHSTLNKCFQSSFWIRKK